MPTSKMTFSSVRFTFLKYCFIILGSLIIFSFLICAYRDWDFGARLSRRDWDFSTHVEIIDTSDGKVHREGRFFQIGPLILNFYGKNTVVQQNPVEIKTNVPVAR